MALRRCKLQQELIGSENEAFDNQEVMLTALD
jgi:hypothetical protein